MNKNVIFGIFLIIGIGVVNAQTIIGNNITTNDVVLRGANFLDYERGMLGNFLIEVINSTRYQGLTYMSSRQNDSNNNYSGYGYLTLNQGASSMIGSMSKPLEKNDTYGVRINETVSDNNSFSYIKIGGNPVNNGSSIGIRSTVAHTYWGTNITSWTNHYQLKNEYWFDLHDESKLINPHSTVGIYYNSSYQNWNLDLNHNRIVQEDDGYEIINASTQYNSTSPKILEITCPTGKRVMSGGGYAHNGVPVASGLAITGTYPLDKKTWRVQADETLVYTDDWQIDAYAVCMYDD